MSDELNKKDIFNLITENALDFLENSIEILDSSPKYSIIHFAAAIELFLKARLVAEHWTLIVSKNQEPDWDRFKNGNFISVNTKEAASRLEKVVNAGLSKDAFDTFTNIFNHRNKMVHFYHEVISEPEKEELKQDIIKEQLEAWYHLHQLIGEKWKDIFSNFKEKIKEMDKKFRKHREYLKVVYDKLIPIIQEKKNEGYIYLVCPSCEFISQEHIPDTKILYNAKCLTCNTSIKSISIDCSNCGEHIIFIQGGFSKCKCGNEYTPKKLAEEIISNYCGQKAIKDGDNCSLIGNCEECLSYHTLINMEIIHGRHDKWFCLSCFDIYEGDMISQCDWCGELTNGDTDMSLIFGCGFCDGNTKLLERD